MSEEQRRKDEERDQDLAHMKTQIDLITKSLLNGGLEKVKVVDTAGRYEEPELDFEEEAKFLNNQGGYRNYNSGNQGRTYQRDNYYDRDGNRDQDSWLKKDNAKNDLGREGVYVPLMNRDRANNGGSS